MVKLVVGEYAEADLAVLNHAITASVSKLGGCTQFSVDNFDHYIMSVVPSIWYESDYEQDFDGLLPCIGFADQFVCNDKFVSLGGDFIRGSGGK